jgi:hypothetical protein
MPIRTHEIVFLLVAWSIAACTQAGEATSSFQISDSAGWNIVHSTRGNWEEGQEWVISPEPEAVIGTLDGPEEYQFVRIEDAAGLSDGGVVVVDGGARAVRLYDSLGIFLKTLAGPGSGPGEVTDPASVMVLAGDTLVVWDPALLRATRFTPSGELLAVHSVDWGKLANRFGVETASAGGSGESKKIGWPGAILFPGPMEPLDDGGFLVRLVEKRGTTPPSGRYRTRSGALRVSADLSVIDTLMLFEDAEKVVVDAPWGKFSVTPPGAQQTWMAHSGTTQRICLGDSEEAEISCFGPGRRKILLRWGVESSPLTEDDVSAWREETVRLLDPKLSRSQVLEILDQVAVPRFGPAFSQLFLDPAGNLWAQRGCSRGGSGDFNDFLVFGPEGILKGIVAGPPMRVLEIGLDYVLGVREDSVGIPFAQVHELKKPWP